MGWGSVMENYLKSMGWTIKMWGYLCLSINQLLIVNKFEFLEKYVLICWVLNT